MKQDKYSSLTPIREQSKSSQKVDEAITETIHQFVVSSGIGFSSAFRIIYRRPIVSLLLWGAVLYFCDLAAKERWIYHLVYQPDAYLTWDRIAWIVEAPWLNHFLGWLTFVSLMVFFTLGLIALGVVVKYNKLFERARLINGRGEAPVLVSAKRLDKFRRELDFNSRGVGLDKFEERKDDLESAFGKIIESISHGKNRSRIKVILTKYKLEDMITYDELSREKGLEEGSFYVGQSMEGVKTQKISELPHMLIAGSTGAGKSVFFKQVLVGLLDSSEHLQLYGIDLKGGIEMNVFGKCPNVRIVKQMSDALALLTKLKEEMSRRFDYLEQSGKREIIPARDGMDRIVLALDEASVLTSGLAKSHPDYQASIEARSLLDSLCKLSRAAAINVILATQKVDRIVLPTQISENISGRMAFKANSVAGSVQVIYSKDAADLPKIPGRGIWLLGSEKTIVQAPFLSDNALDTFIASHRERFRKGHRRLKSKMIEISETISTNKIMDAVEGEGAID